MLTTALDLLGLAALVAALLIASASLFGTVGLIGALFVVGWLSLGVSWVVDVSRGSKARK